MPDFMFKTKKCELNAYKIIFKLKTGFTSVNTDVDPVLLETYSTAPCIITHDNTKIHRLNLNL